MIGIHRYKIQRSRHILKVLMFDIWDISWWINMICHQIEALTRGESISVHKFKLTRLLSVDLHSYHTWQIGKLRIIYVTQVLSNTDKAQWNWNFSVTIVNNSIFFVMNTIKQWMPHDMSNEIRIHIICCLRRYVCGLWKDNIQVDITHSIWNITILLFYRHSVFVEQWQLT